MSDETANKPAEPSAADPMVEEPAQPAQSPSAARTIARHTHELDGTPPSQKHANVLSQLNTINAVSKLTADLPSLAFANAEKQLASGRLSDMLAAIDRTTKLSSFGTLANKLAEDMHSFTIPKFQHVKLLEPMEKSAFATGSILQSLVSGSSIGNLPKIDALTKSIYALPTLPTIGALGLTIDTESGLGAATIRNGLAKKLWNTGAENAMSALSLVSRSPATIFPTLISAKSQYDMAQTRAASSVTAKMFEAGADGSAFMKLSQLVSEQYKPKEFVLNTPSYSAFSTIRRSLAQLVDVRSGFDLPQAKDIRSAFDAYKADHSSRFGELRLKGYLLDSVSATMERMSLPSLDIIGGSSAIRGVLDVHRLSSALDIFPPYGQRTERLLRGELGDWRDADAADEAALQDQEARTNLYLDRGLDKDLTNFSDEAFDALTEGSGLQSGVIQLDSAFGEAIPLNSTELEELDRSTQACRHLIALERLLRQFIDGKMTAAFGSDWTRHRLPKGLLDLWTEKMERAEKSGLLRAPLIEYADFTDYEGIITRRDNWSQIFAPFFERTESVRESFSRLRPVRLAAMHSRRVTNDDMLFLYVEVKRIAKCMGTH